MVPTELIESRVDYLTATCLKDQLHEGQSFERALQWAYDMVQIEHRRGNDLQPWRSDSFEGMRSGQICVGRNEHGLLFRLSGEMAATNWRAVHRDATNISRIDCAATVRLTDRWCDLSRVHHEEALQYQKLSSPHLRVTRIDGGKHGNTLNIGSRASNGYGRIYDKAAESKLEHYQDCWRYEVEFKKEAALFTAACLAEGSCDGLAPAAIAARWLQRRGVRPHYSSSDHVGSPAPQRVSDDDRRLAWVLGSVRPLIAGLISRGRHDEVMVALGLSGIVQAPAAVPGPGQIDKKRRTH